MIVLIVGGVLALNAGPVSVFGQELAGPAGRNRAAGLRGEGIEEFTSTDAGERTWPRHHRECP